MSTTHGPGRHIPGIALCGFCRDELTVDHERLTIEPLVRIAPDGT